MKRLFSPAFLALAAICFFLPFVSISCNASALEGLGGLPQAGPSPIPDLPTGEVEIVSATGWEIVSGADIEPSGEFADLAELGGEVTPSETEEFPGRIYAILAFAIAILGVGVSFLRDRIGAISALVAGILGALFLFLLRTSITGEFGQASLVGFEVNFELGWWLALLFFVAAAAFAGWAMMADRRPVDYAAPPTPTMPPPPATPAGEPPPPATPPGGAPPPPPTTPQEPPPPA